jgi:hypothetical protein
MQDPEAHSSALRQVEPTGLLPAAQILGDDTLDMDVNVPGLTTQLLLDRYVMADNAQLTFLPVEGHPCTAFERSLVFFLIMEWFCFG